jgi:hypothetical protein
VAFFYLIIISFRINFDNTKRIVIPCVTMLCAELFDIYNYIFYQFHHTFDCNRITSVFFRPYSKLQNLILNIKSTNLTPQFFIILQHLYFIWFRQYLVKLIWLLRQIVASKPQTKVFLPYL